jgi:diguanylate cyclase (GGDEF)-like protein
MNETNPPSESQVPAKHRIKVDLAEIERLQQDVVNIENLWGELLYVEWTATGCSRMNELTRQIYDDPLLKKLPSLTKAADALSLRLGSVIEQGDHPSAELRMEIDARIRVLKLKVAALKNGGAKDKPDSELIEQGEPGSGSISARPMIYLFDPDEEYAANLSLQLSQNGYEVENFCKLDDLLAAFARQNPAALIADAFHHEGEVDVLDSVSELIGRDEDDRIPLLFIAARGDYASRHKGWAAGGQAYLMKPVNVPALVGKLDELTQTTDLEPYRVLIVDDDIMISQFNAQVLQQAGMKTYVIQEAKEIMKGLMEFKPDLILLDLYLDECNGFDIAELIRQEEAFVNVPIFFLSGEKARDVHLQALQVGADDFLVKPVDREWLVSVVRSRIKRGRALGARLKYMGRRDPVTGLYNRTYFVRRLEQLLLDRPPGSLAVIYLTLDGYDGLRTHLGVAGLERLVADVSRVITTAATSEDLVARVEDYGFMILSHRRHWEHFVNLAELLHKRIGEHRVAGIDKGNTISATVSVGLCKKEESSLIIAEVEETGSDAAREGGDRVAIAPSLAAIAELQDDHKNHLTQLVENAQAGRVHLAYQPIVSAQGDGVERYEVLFRISNELGEELPVGKLLAAAQRAGMMKKIDQGVLRQAMVSAKKRFDQGRLATLFVKVSADSLDPNHLIKLINHDLKNRGLPGEILVFLLPTKGVRKRAATIGPLIAKLHDMGCHVALDHFGENKADLKLLDDLDIDYVKFHSLLAQEINHNNPKKMENLQQWVVDVRNRNAGTILGYIENAGSMTVAWQIGVDLIQGNFVQPAEGHMTFDFVANS